MISMIKNSKKRYEKYELKRLSYKEKKIEKEKPVLGDLLN